jgi:hypothetical protein
MTAVTRSPSGTNLSRSAQPNIRCNRGARGGRRWGLVHVILSTAHDGERRLLKVPTIAPTCRQSEPASRYFFVLSLALVVVGSGSEPGSAASVMGTRQQEEIVVTGGMQMPPPTDLSVFLASTELVFLGRAESVGVTFLPGDTDHVYTRITFLPIEFMRGASPGGVVDVWELGGSYVETAGGRQARSVAAVAKNIEIGGLYFVPTGRISIPPVSGLHLLRNGDALVRLDAGALVSMSDRRGWARAVIAQGQQTIQTPGPPVDERTAFLAALRRAAAAVP